MLKAQSTLQDMSDFIWPEEQRPTIEHNDYQLDQDLPVIDMAGLQDETHESRLKVAKEIVTACSEWGFFHLINHGIPVEELDEVQEQASRFFELPLDLKQRTSISKDGAPDMYSYGFRRGTTNKFAGRPWNESFRCTWSSGMSSNLGKHAKRVLEGQALRDFQSAMESFCEGAESVAKLLLELCALGLGLAPETFCKITRDRSQSCLNFLRLNHYPVCPQQTSLLGWVRIPIFTSSPCCTNAKWEDCRCVGMGFNGLR